MANYQYSCCKLIRIFITVTVLIGQGSASSENDYVIVNTVSGKIRGQIENYPMGKVTTFFGIPFARPPVKSLRFRPPEPVEPWENILDALEYKPACKQPVSPLPGIFDELKLAEDCLYLNIITPGEISTAEGKAVLVYIYGGGFQYGGAQLYEGSHIANRGDVIFVTIAYRLAIFGSFAYPKLHIRGNLLLLDQLEAFKWLKSNIRSFGGDPDKITVWGQSAGSISIGFHLLSPLSKGLFNRAVMESGSIIYLGTNIQTKATEMNQAILDMADATGCSDKDDDGEFLTCLQEADADVLLKSSMKTFSAGTWLIPTVDNYYMSDIPDNLLKQGNFDPDVDIFVWMNNDEGDVYFFDPRDDFHKPDFGVKGLKSKIDIVASQQTADPQLLDKITSILQYAYEPEDGAATEEYKKAALDLTSDGFRVAIMIESLEHAKISDRNVFMFNFAHRPSWSQGSPIVTAGHFDLPTLVFQPRGVTFTAEEAKLQSNMITALANFAKNGKPGEAWPKFTSESSQYIEYGSTVTTRDLVKYRRKIGLWKDIVFKIRNMQTSESADTDSHSKEADRKDEL